MLCLVSGGADSTCLFHALRELGYRVSALHVDHGLRGESPTATRAWCAERFGAEIVQARRAGRRRPSFATSATVPRRRAARDRATPLRPGRDDPLPARVERERRRDQGAARGRRRPPLLCVWREETEAFCRERGLE